jgi:hypothetical protein
MTLHPRKKLELHKETLRALKVKTGIKAGQMATNPESVSTIDGAASGDSDPGGIGRT